MKIKSVIAALVVFATLLFVGCKDNTQAQTPVTKPCEHSYSEGVCLKCNEKDPNYTASSDDENEDKKDENDNGPVIPPIDLDSELEMPFVPAT